MDIPAPAQRADPIPTPMDERARTPAQQNNFNDTLNRVQDRLNPEAPANPARPLIARTGDTVGRIGPDLDTRLSIERAYVNLLARGVGERALQPSMTTAFPPSVLHYAGQLSSQVFNAALFHQAPGHTALPSDRERESAVPRTKPIDSSGEVNRL